LQLCRLEVPALCLVLFAVSMTPGIVAAVNPPQTDDFEDGTTMSWREGVGSPNPPVNISNGGPGGIGDNYLQNVSGGGIGAGSRLVMFNNAQWTGDYTMFGPVPRFRLHMANFGGTALTMRVAIESVAAGGTQWASTTAAILPPDGNWYVVTFLLSESDMTRVGGTQPLATVLASVTELRILSSTVPAWRGDVLVATLGVDNITASEEIFADSFESADTSAWSNTVP